MRAWPLLVVGVATIAGCLESQSIICANGITCPAETVCDVTHMMCVSQEQLDNCSGMPDGTMCTYGTSTGLCDRGLCLVPACGNGFLDFGELCDDGNQLALDGCSADCSSDEKCGNGMIDLPKGESCDDTNQVDHDGCSSGCQAETAHWVNVSGPPKRAGAILAYDPTRDVLVMRGGNDSNIYYGDTWEWRNGWTAAPPSPPPPTLVRPAGAYDHVRKQVVFEGGLGSTPIGDLYGWDGVKWTHDPAAVGPKLFDHSMAYDGKRKKLVVFGGAISSSGTASNKTWEYDGTAWKEIVTLNAPSAREGAAMTWDPEHAVILLYGGRNGTTVYGDLWSYNGTDWAQKTNATTPVVTQASFAYQPSLHRAVLFGGYTTWAPFNHTGPTSGLWAWDGANWTNLGLTGPAARGDAAMAENGRGQLILFGGATAENLGTVFGDTWILDATGWTQASPPTARYNHAVTLDRHRKRYVLFSGLGPSVAETWELSELGWKKMAGTQPPSTQGSGLVYDEKRKQVVQIGGQPGPGTGNSETWVWNGTIWTNANPFPAPPHDISARLIYDTEREAVLYFAPKPASSFSSDLWSWNGTGWTMLTPTHSPPALLDPSIGYDRVRHQVVLFSGAEMSAPFGTDTWVFEGGDWHLVMPPAGAVIPPVTANGPMVWNAARERLTMVTSPGNGNEAWEWDGTYWTRVDTVSSPVRRSGYDAVPALDGNGVVMIEGYLSGSPTTEMWQLRWDGPVPSDVCSSALESDGDQLVGCADLDCWHVCTPDCPPGTSCNAASARCGDGTCSSIESCLSCPMDCQCVPRCGDFECSTGESCPGDC